ncbi:hypothetical protein L6164_003166 [Bauhinia variegata]|uniref:Uncharacterized protein n=1 Tax=Bauhinia variegata TaxID=167791 RepID=A0ACB9Q0I3_BAUVA|nr:hypothetical protein L6164_003166 [Bauhinia variegata]
MPVEVTSKLQDGPIFLKKGYGEEEELFANLIVYKLEADAETTDKISFSKLKNLKLENLSCSERLRSTNCDLNFPSLKNLVQRQRPNILKELTKQVPDKSTLQCIKDIMYLDATSFREDDHNSIVQLLNKYKVALCASLQYDVELLSWTSVKDICKDGGIIKKILTEGENWENPQDPDEVLVKYEAGLEAGTLVAKSDGVEFTVKEGHFCPALSKAVKTMKKGEEVILTVKPKYGFGETGKLRQGDEGAVPPNARLEIALELVSWKTVSEVTDDKKVLKKILKEGEGYERPNKGAVVNLKVTGKLQDGTVFLKKGYGEEELFEFKTDEEQVIDGLDRGAMTMKKGEVALLTIAPEYAFGSSQSQEELAVVPPNSTVYYEVELVSFMKIFSQAHETSDINTGSEEVKANEVVQSTQNCQGSEKGHQSKSFLQTEAMTRHSGELEAKEVHREQKMRHIGPINKEEEIVKQMPKSELVLIHQQHTLEESSASKQLQLLARNSRLSLFSGSPPDSYQSFGSLAEASGFFLLPSITDTIVISGRPLTSDAAIPSLSGDLLCRPHLLLSSEAMSYLQDGFSRYPWTSRLLESWSDKSWNWYYFVIFVRLLCILRTTRVSNLSEALCAELCSSLSILGNVGFDASWIAAVQTRIHDCQVSLSNLHQTKKLRTTKDAITHRLTELDAMRIELAEIDALLAEYAQGEQMACNVIGLP